MKFLLTVFFILGPGLLVFAQSSSEILTNNDVILMAKSGLAKALIIRKVKESKNQFDVSVPSLVALKAAGIDEEIIGAMMDGGSLINKQIYANPVTPISVAQTIQNEQSGVRPVVSPAEALRTAKTVAITKSSVNPSKQSLEKELLKRQEWQALNLNIVRYKEGADLHIEIGFVHFSWITHRYVFHVYDNRSGTVIVAGETTSWGSLPANLAREISKKLNGVFVNGK